MSEYLNWPDALVLSVTIIAFAAIVISVIRYRE